MKKIEASLTPRELHGEGSLQTLAGTAAFPYILVFFINLLNRHFVVRKVNEAANQTTCLPLTGTTSLALIN